MLERTRSYFENVLSKNFNGIPDHSSIIDLGNNKTIRSRLRNSNSTLKNDEVTEAINEQIMTRKTRTRRPRIPALQSGYCAVCNLPYNNVEDHIQSKKHQKLIGGDANYIALNGSLNGFLQNNSIPFLNLNGVDAIGVHETSFEELSPRWKKRAMPRTRARSVVICDQVKPSPLSPTGSDTATHHLRSRRNINYMTPPSDDDSLEEHPDLSIPVEPVHPEYKEYRELRSSTRALAKLTEETIQEEVWNSGRPKRTCIGRKRYSIDEPPPTNNCKTFYKVEVVTPKLRPSSTVKDRSAAKRQQSRSPKREEEKEKALIVKFKKLRNSELTQLNNEATNFLFPKKDDESSEEYEEADDEVNTIASSVENGGIISVSCSDNEESFSTSQKFKVEDEHSMDSSCSSGKNKKKRRTHAEAFIMDNQKYYKFETPGSRLRYHGSYLPPPVIKSPKHNGNCSPKREVLKMEEPEEKKVKCTRNAKVKLDNYKFSFEKVPLNAPWYSTFQRLDKGEQRYKVFSDYFWDPFILPYQMPSISALDPRNCIHHYNQVLKCLREPLSGTNSRCSTPEHSPNSSPPSTYEPDLDEDSKMSVTTVSSSCSTEEGKSTDMKTRSRGSLYATARRSPGKRPRKSPRQHASTLAILSSLIQHRRKRTKENSTDESSQTLPVILEEETPIELPGEEQHLPENPPEPVPLLVKSKDPVSLPGKPEEPVSLSLEPEESVGLLLKPKESVSVKTKTPRKCKPKIDYFSIARQIDEELDSAIDDYMENYEPDIGVENTIDFHNSKTTLADIMALYEEGRSKETENSCRRFFNGTPGRKPGRRKKMNKTGWPNKNKRQSKRGRSKEKDASNNNDDNDNDASTIDSESVNNDSDEEMCEEEPQPTDSIRKSDSAESEEVTSENNCDVDRVEQNDKVLTNTLANSRLQFQPYVCVQKLDSNNIIKKIDSPKRTNRRQRHMPGSPKSPRMLRKPRGRWYRER